MNLVGLYKILLSLTGIVLFTVSTTVYASKEEKIAKTQQWLQYQIPILLGHKEHVRVLSSESLGSNRVGLGERLKYEKWVYSLSFYNSRSTIDFGQINRIKNSVQYKFWDRNEKKSYLESGGLEDSSVSLEFSFADLEHCEYEEDYVIMSEQIPSEHFPIVKKNGDVYLDLSRLASNRKKYYQVYCSTKNCSAQLNQDTFLKELCSYSTDVRSPLAV